MIIAISALSTLTLIAAQDERLCCHVPEGVWLEGTYSAADCRARGEDFAPQGDGRAAMCMRSETTEIPPNPPGAPGSPGGGPGGDGEGGGGGGSGDGSDGGGSGAGVQVREDASLAEERFDYETVGQASLSELGSFLERAQMQRDFCDVELQGTQPESRAAGPDAGECYANLRANVHLVTQNAGRMRNSRDLTEDERQEAVHIHQSASELRDYADGQLEGQTAD